MKLASIRALEMALEREAFGQHLRRLRQQRALSQEAAAHDIGCSVKSLQNWEGGVATPNPGSMRLLARFYGEPLGTLTSYIPDYRREAPPSDRLERVEAMLAEVLERLEEISPSSPADAADAAEQARPPQPARRDEPGEGAGRPARGRRAS